MSFVQHTSFCIVNRSSASSLKSKSDLHNTTKCDQTETDIFTNLVISKGAAKHELLFAKPANELFNQGEFNEHSSLTYAAEQRVTKIVQTCS